MLINVWINIVYFRNGIIKSFFPGLSLTSGHDEKLECGNYMVVVGNMAAQPRKYYGKVDFYSCDCNRNILLV